MNDWANAVKDAKDVLAEQKQNSSENDDPAFLKNVLFETDSYELVETSFTELNIGLEQL